MAEPRKITTKTGMSGYDLNDVVREVLRRVMDNRHLGSVTELAETLGIPQSTMDRLMKDGKFDLDRLSAICAALEVNPVAFFASHPLYDHEARAFMRFGKDALYDKFRTLLSPDEARRVVKGLELQKELGIFEVATRTVDALTESAKAAQRKTIRDVKKPRAQG